MQNSFLARLIIPVLIFSLATGPAFAEAEAGSNRADKIPSYFDLPFDSERPRNTFWPAFGSLILPGLDQWLESQTGWAATYSGVAGIGLFYSSGTAQIPEKRHFQLGAQLYSAAGGYSAYHSFRSAVTSRKKLGQYEFLKIDETPRDIFLAPFQFSHLANWKTWIPIGAAVVIGGLIAATDSRFDPSNFTIPDDGYFTAATSYLAGTWEEAAFRGWLMPLLMENSQSPFVSNLLTSALFAAAHYPAAPIPIAQFLFGMWAGWVTQENDWTLSQAIFGHVWYDVIVISVANSLAAKSPVVILPTISVPL